MDKKLCAGDVFAFSDVVVGQQTLSLDANMRLGKVIFVSKVSRNVIGILISQRTFSSVPADLSDIEFMDLVFYTGSQLFKRGDWAVVGTQEVSQREEDLTFRIIGSSLWRLDSNLGLASADDLRGHQKQLIYGFGALYNAINKL